MIKKYFMKITIDIVVELLQAKQLDLNLETTKIIKLSVYPTEIQLGRSN